jgi:fatty-acid desaturase
MKLRPSATEFKTSWKNIIWIGGLHVLALALAVPFFSWQGLIVFAVLHYLTGMVGITFGFHRLLTHRSFRVPAAVENMAALAGTLACQGGPINWVGQHRCHHAYSDTPQDPHDANKGFWHAHFLAFMIRRQDLERFEDYKHYAPDLAERKFFVWLENNMILVQVLFGIMMIALGGLIGPAAGFDWFMGASFAVWGFFVRLVAGYHVTWLVNSAAHFWGTNDNNLEDRSRNNWWVGILAFGEGWHNNHHAQPRVARHGWTWWQFDQTWIMIKTLKMFGLASDIKLPRQIRKAVDMQAAGKQVEMDLGITSQRAANAD